MVMVASVSELQEYRMPSLPRNLEAGRGKTKGEWVAEAGVIVATVAATIVLALALRAAQGDYTILGL
jgi:hypothetical protein